MTSPTYHTGDRGLRDRVAVCRTQCRAELAAGLGTRGGGGLSAPGATHRYGDRYDRGVSKTPVDPRTTRLGLSTVECNGA